MFGKQRWLNLLLALLVLASLSCVSGPLDDGDSADVVLEILTMTSPPITGTENNGVCVYTVTEWTANVTAVPKNSLATSSPFNDVIMVDMLIDYTDIDGNPLPGIPQRTQGLGDSTVEAGGTQEVTFSPIAFDDLLTLPPSSTVQLTMTFNARTVEGTGISDTASRWLNVEDCLPTSGP